MMRRLNLIIILSAALIVAGAAAAGTITVTTSSDPIDIDPASGTISDLPGPDGIVSFSEALIAANNTLGADTITFAIPQAEWPLQWYLPGRAVVQGTIPNWHATDGVTIDGTTQTAFTGDTNPDGAEVSFFGGQLYFSADNCVVRGVDNVQMRFEGSNNIISGNSVVGIELYGGSGSRVQGNQGGFVKIDQSNDNVVTGNTFGRVRVVGWFDGGRPATNNRIGGPDPADRNVILGYGTWSSQGVPSGYAVQVFETVGTVVENNSIGTTPDGMSRANDATTIGVSLESRNTNVVVRSNRIAGIIARSRPHLGPGIWMGTAIVISGAGDGFSIVGNTIGLNAAGDPVLGSVTGIDVGTFFSPGLQAVNIGGPDPGQGNEIAGHLLNGIIVGREVQGARISGNSIHDNQSLGIDLVTSGSVYGVTPNDAQDLDTGGNGLQNFALVQSATSTGSSLRATGTLQGAASAPFRLEFFASPDCDASGHGEGQVFVGATMVTTDGAGHAAYDVAFGATVADGWVLTSTTTREPLGATSEFSPCAAVVTDASPVPPAEATTLTLAAARPNPFNPRTTLSFVLPRSGAVELVVHDLAGNRVATLLDGSLDAGLHEVAWAGVDDRGRPVPTGVYVSRLVAFGEVRTGKLVLLK